MGRYWVYLQKVVSTSVEVEAEDGDEAVEKALQKKLPELMFLNHEYPDAGEWMAASDMFPKLNKPENDWELIKE